MHRSETCVCYFTFANFLQATGATGVIMTPHHWHGQTFWLTKERLMYWEQEKMLIASDLHIGKTGHFRKHGIAVPQDIYKEDMQRLFTAIQYFKPKQFVIVGDLFHSHANKELLLFTRWRNDFPSIDFILVKGNHDILPAAWYADNNIKVYDCLELNDILLVHDKDCKTNPAINGTVKGIISGHIHPAVVVSSGPRQAVRLPCFYFNGRQCILPAYSHFTGTFALHPQKRDAVYAITSSEILSLKY
jgi:DNA ligase-associated metallophosphoesterase